jgi:hypothetical protein
MATLAGQFYPSQRRDQHRQAREIICQFLDSFSA